MTSLLWSVAAYAGWLAWAATAVPLLRRRPAIALALIGLAAYPAAWVLRGILSDPSYTTGLLVWAAAIHRLRAPATPAPPMFTAASGWTIVATALALYATTLGNLPADLYHAPGYELRWAVALLFGAAGWHAYRAGALYGRIFPAALALALSGIHESRNAWDWFLDPALMVLAAVEIVRAIRTRRDKPTTADAQAAA